MHCISTSSHLSFRTGTEPPQARFEGLPGHSLSPHSPTSDGPGFRAGEIWQPFLIPGHLARCTGEHGRETVCFGEGWLHEARRHPESLREHV